MIGFNEILKQKSRSKNFDFLINLKTKLYCTPVPIAGPPL